MRTIDVQELVRLGRLDAAQREWERQQRVRLVAASALIAAVDMARAGAGTVGQLLAELEGIAEVLRGEWTRSPKDMAAQRAAGENRP